MKIITTGPAKVTLLFPFEEISPHGGTIARNVIDKIMSRYKFLRGPDISQPLEKLNKDGYKFESGQFTFANKDVGVISFAVYGDGIVAEASTTEMAEAYLNDVIDWARAELSFRDFSTKPKQYVASQVVIEFDKPFAKLINSYLTIARSISKYIEPIFGTDILPNIARLDFEIDKTSVAMPVLPTKFIIERRAGVSFESERYYSAAPINTNDHIKVLEEIERLLS